MTQNQSFARRERQALATALREAGPDAPTLCEGWNTADLAAHVWQRDNRVWEGIGLAVKPLAGLTDKGMQRIRRRPLDVVAGEIAEGPVSKVSAFQVPKVNEMANQAEMFIHTEDVRRANGHTEPRVFDPADTELLWKQALQFARMGLRKAPVGVALARTGARPVLVKKPAADTAHQHHGAHAGSGTVTVVGPAGEILLWLSGRREHAHVELQGAPEDIEKLRGFQSSI